MTSEIVPKVFLSIACLLGCTPGVSAHIRHERQAHYARVPHIRSIRAPGLFQTHGYVSPPPMIAYQGYDGPAYLGHRGIPQSPLVPLKTEVPPPVDPDEPTSGSYGAMVHGFNAAGTGY